MSYHVRTECRLCDAKLPDERVLDLGSSPLANALLSGTHRRMVEEPLLPEAREFTAPLYLKACSACGHVQLPVVVDPNLLFPAEYPYCSSTGAAMREHLTLMARELDPELTKGFSDEPPFVVEIGSNDGYLLGEFRRLGCRSIGIDPAAKLAASATARGGLTLPEFFNTPTARAVRNACGHADLIVANNVFAHADDLHEIVEGVKVLLAPEGRFVFEVGWLADIIAKNNFGVVYHEHLSQHTLAPLVRFFERLGMQLYDAKPVATQGGSMRYFVSWPGAHSADWPQMEEMDRWERRWCNPAELSRWQSRVDYAANAFASELTRLKMAGKTIAAYGCSAKSTTLLHVAGIGRETIDFICDDAPTKQGKFSPGKHLPIVPGSWLEEKQPDYCVSLSGNFSEAFKAAHPLYKGEWLEPDLGGGA